MAAGDILLPRQAELQPDLMGGKVVFNEEQHKYHWVEDGEEIPLTSASQIIHSLGLVDYSGVPKSALAIGTARHLATEVHDMGGTEAEAVASSGEEFVEDTEPALAGWKLFLSDVQPEIEFVEVRVASKVQAIAGTIDRVAIVDGHRAIVDVKGVSSSGTYGIQTALYGLMFEAVTGLEVHSLYTVHLNKHGSYKLRSWDYAEYAEYAKAAVVMSKWRSGEIKMVTSPVRSAMGTLSRFTEKHPIRED